MQYSGYFKSTTDKGVALKIFIATTLLVLHTQVHMKIQPNRHAFHSGVATPDYLAISLASANHFKCVPGARDSLTTCSYVILPRWGIPTSSSPLLLQCMVQYTTGGQGNQHFILLTKIRTYHVIFYNYGETKFLSRGTVTQVQVTPKYWKPDYDMSKTFFLTF